MCCACLILTTPRHQSYKALLGKAAVDEWVAVACIEDGLIFSCVTHSGTVWGSGISEKVVWWVVRQAAKKAAIEKVAPHDLRRTCARLCHSAGGELEQIQFLLGHRSVETTERYLGSRQRIVHALNDKLGIEPDAPPGRGSYRKCDFSGGSRDHFRVAGELVRDPKDKSRPFTARQVPWRCFTILGISPVAMCRALP